MRTGAYILSTFCVQILGVLFPPSSPQQGYSHAQHPGKVHIYSPRPPVPNHVSSARNLPLRAGPDFSADFPHPWYPWAGNLGHRPLGRGLLGRLGVTGRKLRSRESEALSEAASATCPVRSIHPSLTPHPQAPSVAYLWDCAPPHVQGHPPIAEAAGIGIEGRGTLGKLFLPNLQFPPHPDMGTLGPQLPQLIKSQDQITKEAVTRPPRANGGGSPPSPDPRP